MTVKEKTNINAVKNVVSTMAIENMYFRKEFLKVMVEAANGEKTYEDIRRAVIEKYAR